LASADQPLDLLSPEVMADPASAYRRLYSGAKVYHYPNFNPPFYIAYRYRDVETMLRDPSLFLSGQGQGPNFSQASGVVSDPPDHTFYRSLVQDVFQPAAIAALEPELRGIAEAALGEVAGQETWDLHDTLAFPLPIRIICRLLGIPQDDIWQFKHWSDAAVAALASEDAGQFAEMTDALSNYILDLIRQKRAAPDESLISRIAAGSRDDQPIPDSEAVSLVSQMFVAGNETTTSLITNFVWRLMRQDRWQDFVAGALELDDTINESLRYDPPLLALFRTTAKDLTLNGCDIPAGSKVMMHFGAANRDPDIFADPDRFIPGRAGPRSLSFGLGIHSCLGKELARLETRIALDTLRQHFPDLRLVNDGERIAPFIFWGRSKLPVKNLNH